MSASLRALTNRLRRIYFERKAGSSAQFLSRKHKIPLVTLENLLWVVGVLVAAKRKARR